MAGRPILRAYLARVDEVGVQNILNQIADGASIAAVARTIGTSRCFLSTFLNSTSEGVEALAVAREIAAANGPRSKGYGTRSELYGWAKASARPQLNNWLSARLSLSHRGPRGADRANADHLEALKMRRAERLEESHHSVTSTPKELANIRATA